MTCWSAFQRVRAAMEKAVSPHFLYLGWIGGDGEVSVNRTEVAGGIAMVEFS